MAAQLEAAPAQRYVPEGSAETGPAPVGAYLQSLTVRGFRGIGSAATLNVHPGPGLTLVVGRNGSGKSSFAEGLEVLLTGTLMRWASAPSVVRDGWKNKHAANGTEVQTEIRADFLIEGKGKAIVARTWAAGADLGGSGEWMQVADERRTPTLDGLGWAKDLGPYRPFLSHAELEAFFGRPLELHDLLASVLGLDELTNASSRLNAARKQREDALTAVKRRLEVLKVRLGELDDERAAACLTALQGRNWDLRAAEEIVASGRSSGSGQLASLRELAQLSPPAVADVTTAVAALRAAAGGLDNAAGGGAEQATHLAQLLDDALRHHEAHGDGDCPVCGRPGALTKQWHDATRQHLERLRKEAQEAYKAAEAAKSAAEQAIALVQPPPRVLSEAVAGVDLAPARDTWLSWANRPGNDLTSSPGLRALADHLETSVVTLTDTVTGLSAAASAELTKRDDQWTPLARDVASWCADAEPAVEASQRVKALKDARKWLNDAAVSLRNTRLAPLAGQAREIWAELRQESNVDLGAFRLTGTATRRALDLDVTIDGTPGAALGVMSQGEINALALSIFLPRATMASSPFRFLVIDDPVQAMDPAKVNGLARVLAKVAERRQVIVFTHDNRLAAAVKELSIPATILEVTRRPQSVVDVRPCLDAVQQAFKDAGALTADRDVPREVARRVVPGLCRTALEAAFTQAFWRQQLRAGQTREAIDAKLAASRRQLTPIAALGMFGDAQAESRVLSTLNRWGHGFADTFQALNKGSHERYAGDLGKLIVDTRKLAGKIEEKLP